MAQASRPVPGEVAQKAVFVLLAEGDLLTREMLAAAMTSAGFLVHAVATREALAGYLATQVPDAVVMARQLADDDVLAALPAGTGQEARPRCLVLNGGAPLAELPWRLAQRVDEVWPKPVDEHDLIHRLRDVAATAAGEERSDGAAATADACFAGWRLSRSQRVLVAPDGTAVAMTESQFRLLLAFARNPNKPLSREWLTQAALGRAWHSQDRSIDMIVGWLRKKLRGSSPGAGSYPVIRTIRGVGYRFDATVTWTEAER